MTIRAAASPRKPSRSFRARAQNSFKQTVYEMEDIVTEFLHGHNTMSLATSRDNYPYAASLFYASDGLTLYFLSNPDSEHSLNISINPKVAVTISTDHADWRTIRGLQIMGRAYEVREEEAELARNVFEKKYPFLTELMGSDKLPRGAGYYVFFKVVPETLRFIDNRVYFGYRAEMLM